MTVAPNSTTFSYRSALRLLARNGPTGLADLAAADGRLKHNLRRDLPKLEESGLVAAYGDLLSLTEAGEQWVRGQDIAEGLVSSLPSPSATPEATLARWPMDAIRPNPLNRKVTDEGIAELAEAIIAAGDIVVPLILTPPDANGVRTLLAGERRWTAVRSLAEEGRTPEALADGLPFVEREATEAEALLITLLENSNRKDLTPWEDAQQLKKLADATQWSAAELARRIGRQGSERDVQVKLKIAREATPEAIADYEATRSWDRLRDSVTKSKGPQPENVHLALFIVETALRSHQEHWLWDGVVTLQPALVWPESWTGWFGYNPDNGRANLTMQSLEWLKGQGLDTDTTASDDKAEAEILKRARAACGLTNRPALRPFVTECLNWTPEAEQADQEPDTAPLPLEVADAAPQAEAYDPLTWRELLYAINAGIPLNSPRLAATEVGAYWLCDKATQLVKAGLVTFLPRSGQGPVATLTDAGVEAANKLAMLWGTSNGEVDWANLVNLVMDDGIFDGTRYATPWLQNLLPAPQPVPIASEPEQTDLEQAAQTQPEPLRFYLDEAARVSPVVMLAGRDKPLIKIDDRLLLAPAKRFELAMMIIHALNAAEVTP